MSKFTLNHFYSTRETGRHTQSQPVVDLQNIYVLRYYVIFTSRQKFRCISHARPIDDEETNAAIFKARTQPLA